MNMVLTGTAQIWSEKGWYWARLNKFPFRLVINGNTGEILLPSARPDVGARAQGLSLSGQVQVEEHGDEIVITNTRFSMNLTRSDTYFHGTITLTYPGFNCPLEGDKVTCQIQETG